MFSPLQIQVLKELDIDLWLNAKQGTTPVESSNSVPLTMTHNAASGPEPEAGFERDQKQRVGYRTDSDVQGMQDVHFELLCARNSCLVAVAEQVTAADRKFLSSLLRVTDLGNKAESIEFRWPQLRSGNSDLSAARKAFSAFADVQLRDLNRPLLLVFGSQVQELLTTDPNPGQVFGVRWHQINCICAPELSEMRRHAALKRELWIQLSKLEPSAWHHMSTGDHS